MKILIIGFSKIKYMPYLNLYLENLNREKHDIHLVYWNRDLKNEDLSGLEGITLHEFRCYQEDDVNKLYKIPSFLKFKVFAQRLLKEKYDFIISLHSVGSVLLSKILTRDYKGKYIYDYRDYTYENFGFYKRIVDKLVECSKATFVSSDAFRKFLPKQANGKIYTSHNFLSESLGYRDICKRKSDGKIRLAFWGFIRHREINREMIKKISTDERFELHYYGREQQDAEDLKAFVEEINAKNVFFHGEYLPEDRYEFAEKTDIIHNIYLGGHTDIAMGNKFYDGLIFRIPQICMVDSYMGNVAEKEGVGKMLDPKEDTFTNQIYDYYSNISFSCFNQCCDDYLEKVVKQTETIKGIIKRI